MHHIKIDIIVKDWLRVDRIRKDNRVFLYTQIGFWNRNRIPENQSGHFRNQNKTRDQPNPESRIRNWTGSVSMRSTAAQGDEDHEAGEQADEEFEYEDGEAGKKPQTRRQFRIVSEPELEDGSEQSRKSGKLGNLEV